ncbi:hypothetical protein HG535_0A03480 [Zygotorulaspora mrakii]|uniref:Uncharacterized protein n=1 Tax=Zygotorulaspora mrakii TaxID=42260 RepID=A0A7H9AX99_ZYGMR|nr:uncharacterized protein HG535_0A03480 [Zygotorulaspora mrakii]QLG70409.1 hypothetical protein HG535_0A03480 [Zygotorulaspora mrakii]
MLRRSKSTINNNGKKRHSMFIDLKHSILSANDPITESTFKHSFQTKNKSLDSLALEDDLTLQEVPQKMNRKAITAKKTSKLKRSSVVLDNSLLRDYNIAVNHFENPVSTTIQSSHSNHSISSVASKISSLFSSNSCLSIHDLLNEDITDENKKQKTSIRKQEPVKAVRGAMIYLFDADQGSVSEHIWDFDDEYISGHNNRTYNRTELIFD